jgi:hypothetical protein
LGDCDVLKNFPVVQLDIIRETEVNITSAMADQSDSLAVERKNHKNSSTLLAKVQDRLAAQPGDCSSGDALASAPGCDLPHQVPTLCNPLLMAASPLSAG